MNHLLATATASTVSEKMTTTTTTVLPTHLPAPFMPNPRSSTAMLRPQVRVQPSAAMLS
jgi:hypothetical protein